MMRKFSLGQRVIVRAAGMEHGGAPVPVFGMPGTVARVRTDGGAWMALDRRVEFASNMSRPSGRAAYCQRCNSAQRRERKRRCAA